MDRHIEDIIAECTKASGEERISFPDVVKTLMGAGVERYLADLSRAEMTYYLPDGSAKTLPSHRVKGEAAQEFSAEGVEAAVRAIQGGKIKYREFCERITQAGCVAYIVSIAGRRAIYFGRTGDLYVEKFPGSK